MNKRWIAFFGAMLLGATILGCDSGQKVTVPDSVPPPPAGGPTTGGDTAAPLGGAPAPAKTP